MKPIDTGPSLFLCLLILPFAIILHFIHEHQALRKQ